MAPWSLLCGGLRDAVCGGSHGDHMTLMCLFEAPQLFKAGIAYPHVTDRGFHDTIYTDRYMGTPDDNTAGSREGAGAR